MDSDIQLLSASSKITFKVFTNLLEQINKIAESTTTQRAIPKNEEKKRLLQKFYEMWRTTSMSLKKQSVTSVNDNYFAVMRLLLPADDPRSYGLKESRLAKYLIEALCIAPKSDDALKLINYRAPTSIKVDGDFASVAFFVLKTRCQETSTLTIEEINIHLDTIAINNFKGKEGLKEVNKSIKHLLVSLSALQLKWLIRIILKDLKIGIKELTIFESFHPDAMNLYNFSSSLEKVCSTLTDPTRRLDELCVSVFTPCRPMLGEKTKPSRIEELLGGKQFYIETKFDGERFQLHKQGSKFMYFSRNSYDYTETFDISLSPFIQGLFKSDVKSVILDGEMCTYNVKEKMLMSLTEEWSVKAKEKTSSSEPSEIQTCYCVFDILMFNEELLTNKPLKQRVEYLSKTFTEKDGRLVMSHRELAKRNQEVVEALNEAIDNRLEGIVVKDPDSVYKPSVRSGSGWYKIKPDYMLGLNDDLDCLIIGGYYGSGKCIGTISHFLIGVGVCEEGKLAKPGLSKRKSIESGSSNLKDDDDDDLNFFGEEQEENMNKKKLAYDKCVPKLFYSFAKIGSGYTYKELRNLNHKLSDKWVKFDRSNPPKCLEMGLERPDVWIEPCNSIVVQVKAVEITQTEKYRAGLTLRFPRLEKFREDKAWYECIKLSELNELYKKNEGMLTSGKHLELDKYDEEGNLIDPDGEPVLKRKKVIKRVAKTIVSDRFKGVDASQIKKSSSLFSGKEICVIVGNDKWNKGFIEKKIIECGGEIVQNPGANTFCIVTAKLIHKINIYIQKDLYDVVKIDWIFKCVDEGRYVPWKPSDMFHSRVATKEYFNTIFDSYGDSYEEELTPDGLKEIFENMQQIPGENLDDDYDRLKLREQIALIENKYFPNELFPYGLFRLDMVYVDFYEDLNGLEKKRINNSSLDLIEARLKWHGGFVQRCVDERTTHCIFEKNDLSRLSDLKKFNRKRKIKMHLVSSEWVFESIKAGRKLNELPFHV